MTTATVTKTRKTKPAASTAKRPTTAAKPKNTPKVTKTAPKQHEGAASLTQAVKVAKQLLTQISEFETNIEQSANSLEGAKWELAERTRQTLKDDKLCTAQTWAEKLGVQPSWVSSLVKTAELFGDADYRIPQRSFNDHVELAKIGDADKRDKVLDLARENETSVVVARKHIAAAEKAKVERQQTTDSRTSVASKPKGGKGAVRTHAGVQEVGAEGKANLELRTAVEHLVEEVAHAQTAVADGARLSPNEAAELKALGEALIKTANESLTPVASATKSPSTVKRVKKTA